MCIEGRWFSLITQPLSFSYLFAFSWQYKYILYTLIHKYCLEWFKYYHYYYYEYNLIGILSVHFIRESVAVMYKSATTGWVYREHFLPCV